MLNTRLSARNRSFSQRSIRKRMLRSNSGHQSQKQLIKSSTMTSFKPKLQRLIQEGKIQQIINSDRHSKGNLLYSSHINEMQKQLGNSKKNLSSMVLKTKTKQFSINKLKNEIMRLLKQKRNIQENSQSASKTYEKSLGLLASKKEQKEIIQWTEKTYSHLKERLIKDQYFHKRSYELRQKQLEQQKHRSQFLQRRTQQIICQNKELQRAINAAKKISSQQTFHKNEIIDIINQDRQQKQFLHSLRTDKQRKQASINELSAWVIEKEELQKYLNILYTHRILRQIINTKNINLMKKYEKTQNAYLRIKSNTNIIEFDKILRKMEQQDTIYDITIKKVSNLEQQLEMVEKKLEQAKREKNNILSQGGKNLVYQKLYYRGIQKDKYELFLSQKEKLEFRNIQDQIRRQRILDWTQKVCQKLRINKGETQTFENTLQKVAEKIKTKVKQGHSTQ